jgi:hypothetical protein
MVFPATVDHARQVRPVNSAAMIVVPDLVNGSKTTGPELLMLQF